MEQIKSSINIKETPHYKFLQGLENEYKNYLEFCFKMPDVSGHSIKKYKDLLTEDTNGDGNFTRNAGDRILVPEWVLISW